MTFCAVGARRGRAPGSLDTALPHTSARRVLLGRISLGILGRALKGRRPRTADRRRGKLQWSRRVEGAMTLSRAAADPQCEAPTQPHIAQATCTRACPPSDALAVLSCCARAKWRSHDATAAPDRVANHATWLCQSFPFNSCRYFLTNRIAHASGAILLWRAVSPSTGNRRIVDMSLCIRRAQQLHTHRTEFCH